MTTAPKAIQRYTVQGGIGWVNGTPISRTICTTESDGDWYKVSDVEAELARLRAKNESLKRKLGGIASEAEHNTLPEGYSPALAFSDGKEVVVMGWPRSDDATDDGHNCDQMGCGSISEHVVGRLSVPADMEVCDTRGNLIAAYDAAKKGGA